jgi:predicted lipoprotein with Yx(FWY)xxD motif/polyisoprenoid-binding protein YceI
MKEKHVLESRQINHSHFKGVLVVMVMLTLVLAACQSATPEPTLVSIPTEPPATESPEHNPVVSVSDQEIAGGTVSIAEVISDGPGWLVIHAQAEGKPGPILGYSPVADGETKSVVVEIDTANATEALYAMLHTDAGEIGEFEFPDGPDAPVKVDEKVVTPAFMISGLTTVEAMKPSVSVSDQEMAAGSVKVANVVSKGAGWLVIHAEADGKPGPILGYTALEDGESIDVLVEIDTGQATETLYAMLHTDVGETGEFEFPDGPDAPVVVDEKVVTPAFKFGKVMAKDASGELLVSLSGSDKLGPFLVGPDEMTLYLFTNDEEDVTNCYGRCAENWPPLVLEDGQTLEAGEGVVGELGTTERTDGGSMVTYNGMPLYYWIKDAAPGDTTGHGVGGVWAVVGPETRPYFMDASASQVSYEVGEVFLDDNRFNAAVGVTSGINGKVYLDLTNPLASLVSPIEVDISQFNSDSQRRDSKIRSDFLESAAFPFSTFVPTQIEGLPDSYNEGDQLPLQIIGDLTVKEVTQPVTFDATVVAQDGQLSGKATSTILMSDFGVGPISILGILETEDEVLLKINFVAQP